MSLPDDYGMYYSQTYVGFREQDGTVTPFYVERVSWDQSVSIHRSETNDLSNIRHLVFRGNKVIRAASGEYIYQNPINISVNNLILDVPLMGYYEIEGSRDPVWLYHLPQRSTKKGFASNKTNIGNVMRTNTPAFLKLVCEIFNDTRSKIGRDFYQNVRNNTLLYKGIIIGKVVPESGIVLKKKAKYLTSLAESFMSGV